MTREQHRARHERLLRDFDQLLQDYVAHNPTDMPSLITVTDLLAWAFLQTKFPTGLPPGRPEVHMPETCRYCNRAIEDHFCAAMADRARAEADAMLERLAATPAEGEA